MPIRFPAVAMLGATLLNLAGPAAASPVRDLVALTQDTQRAGARAVNTALDEAAAYWFARDRNGRASLAGSGPALAAAIRLGRAEALRSRPKPLPADLKRALRPHYSKGVLDRARFVVAAPDSRLGRLLARWPVQNGAVTLGEVIVFKTARGPASKRLVAHELVHVDQYSRLGIDRFAHRYAANRTALEKEATDKASRIMRAG